MVSGLIPGTLLITVAAITGVKVMALRLSCRLYIIKPHLNTAWFHIDNIRETMIGA